MAVVYILQAQAMVSLTAFTLDGRNRIKIYFVTVMSCQAVSGAFIVK